MTKFDEILSLNDLVLAFINGQDLVHMDEKRCGTVTTLERTEKDISVHVKPDMPSKENYVINVPAKGNSRVRGFHIRQIFPRINESRDI